MNRASVPRAIPDRDRVNMSWLVRLRWAEIAGQASTVLVVHVALGVALPVLALAIVVGIGLCSNLMLSVWLGGVRPDADRPPRTVTEPQVAAVMALDVTLLTALLYLTGGPLNPFGFLYLVQIALATVLVHAAWTWSLVALSFGGFGLLLVAHRPLDIPDHTRMVGTWVALGVAAAFIVTFLRRIAAALAERDHELAQAKNLTARQERLASLATMAAGAAHELSTPLGTVALVAKELERALEKGGNAELVADAKLIRGEVGRCRAILDQMAGGAGAAGESLETQSVDALLDLSLTGVRTQPAVRRELAASTSSATVQLPPRAISQALRSLVTNAQDASSAETPVVVRVSAEDDQLRIEIIDRGPGMPAELLARIGEPFFTTKQPGRGMGLGLFLARAVFESVGGAMAIDSTMGAGTQVIVTLPRAIAIKPIAPTRDPRAADPAKVVSTRS
ncbi:MAG: sensor histidine kinase [Deltaproteobacteria bacterium]|nr:sensor histidine kinase [Deltaproteobacteria bacterium]